MSRGQVLYLNITAALVTLTGAVFAVMKYCLRSEDELSVVNHPLQPHMLSAHVVIAPLLVFGFGWVFANHVWPKLVFKDPRNRRSGIGALSLIAPMSMSGYLMQIATNDAIRQAMAVAHWVSSALFVIVYVMHLVKPRAAEAARSEPAGGEASVPFRASLPRRK